MGDVLGVLVLLAIAGGLIGGAIYFFRQDKRIKQVFAENAQLQAYAASVEAENKRLVPYAVVPDANVEAARIIQEGNRQAQAQEAQMQAYTAQVTEWADNLIKHAQADENLSRQKKEEYETIAAAMRNVIEGYGSQYLIPALSLIDDLAQDFGFLDAGEKLKKARALTRAMVKGEKAATSGYPDKERRDAACDFVLDAFNGKVDTALASVKAENAGILGQKIKDAFTLVNTYGKTFGDTRITQAYLKARLDELNWAAVAQQLRLDQREEQRRIKEQMREDEKARREIEKARLDAERQEEALAKALEVARREAIEAGEEKAAAYREKIEELTRLLQEQGEKKEMAISMARQTKKGKVYVISNIGSFGEGIFKIGQTRRLVPQDRIDELSNSSVPFGFDVHAMVETDDAPGLEYQLHKHFVLSQVNKANSRKEFFRLDLAELRKNVEALGLDVKWTMTATADQYRQTLNIEKSLATDPAFKAEWMKKQIRLKFEAPNGRDAGTALDEESDDDGSPES